jgi:hypothetical protein
MTASDGGPESVSYVLGRSEAETRRLMLQHQMVIGAWARKPAEPAGAGRA